MAHTHDESEDTIFCPQGPGHGERPHQPRRPAFETRLGHPCARRYGACGQGRPGERVVSIGGPRDGGGVVGRYRKLHLFAEEKHCFEPGDLGLPVFETRWGTVGICVCYDLRFVEVVRILALRGADLVCVPTAWVTGFDRKPPNPDGLCPQAEGAVLQANLSQVFIACASQVGTFGNLLMLGSSVLVDPYGSLAAGPLPGDEERLAIADIDLAEATRAQSRSPLIQPRADRRTDVYHLAYDRQRF